MWDTCGADAGANVRLSTYCGHPKIILRVSVRCDLVEIYYANKRGSNNKQTWREASHNCQLPWDVYSEVSNEIYREYNDEDLWRHVNGAIYNPEYTLRWSVIFFKTNTCIHLQYWNNLMSSFPMDVGGRTGMPQHRPMQRSKSKYRYRIRGQRSDVCEVLQRCKTERGSSALKSIAMRYKRVLPYNSPS